MLNFSFRILLHDLKESSAIRYPFALNLENLTKSLNIDTSVRLTKILEIFYSPKKKTLFFLLKGDISVVPKFYYLCGKVIFS